MVLSELHQARLSVIFTSDNMTTTASNPRLEGLVVNQEEDSGLLRYESQRYWLQCRAADVLLLKSQARHHASKLTMQQRNGNQWMAGTNY